MNKRIRSAIYAATILGMLASFYVASSEGMAASHAPKRAGALILVDKSDTTQTATSEGVGNQMQTWLSGFSTFNLKDWGGGVVTYVNQSNNCIHGTSGGNVTIDSSCGSNNTASQWTLVVTGGITALRNVAYGGYIFANGDGNGNGMVLAALGTPGKWLMKSTGS